MESISNLCNSYLKLVGSFVVVYGCGGAGSLNWRDSGRIRGFRRIWVLFGNDERKRVSRLLLVSNRRDMRGATSGGFDRRRRRKMRAVVFSVVGEEKTTKERRWFWLGDD
ncbi:hypothetical protein HAX54_027256 [Datura stramonium]|uniref:Uncharacterized protein n=1 Tax=Datura stramonium TaxID=4076 RepID=A0ABS8V235_DATST|nr:hypothetical protein [Datura stramonium]